MLATLGRSAEAVVELEAALDADPGALAAIHGLVQACFQTGNLAVAERRVRTYLDGHPGNLDLAFALAGLRFQLGDLNGALEAIEGIALFNPDYAGLTELRQKIESA